MNPSIEKTTTAGRVAVILIHYGDPARTRQALRSVWGGTVVPRQAIVVDNDPHPLPSHADPHFETPSTIILRTGRNLGFATAVNLALHHIEADFELAWLLNNDAVAAPMALEELLKAHQIVPRALISSLVLVRSGKPWFRSATFLPWRLEGRHYQRPWPQFPGLPGSNVHVAPQRTSPVAINYVPFCSTLIPLRALAVLGPLDDAFFVYGEDVDYCVRAQRAGWSVAVAHRSVVWHHESASTEPSYREYLKARTSVTLVRRYFPWLLPYALPVAVAAGLKRAIEHRQPWWISSRMTGYFAGLRDGRDRRCD